MYILLYMIVCHFRNLKPLTYNREPRIHILETKLPNL